MLNYLSQKHSGTPYGEFLAELDEIQRLKWLASENASHDIGFEFALNDWAQNHRSEWRRSSNLALLQRAHQHA